MCPEPEAFLPLPHLPLHILLALSSGETLHGWAIIKRIERMTDGTTCPSTGSLYLAMGRMAERGLIDEVPAPSMSEDTRRKHYRVTTLGRRVAAAETHRLAGLLDVARAARLLDSGR